MQDVPGFCRRLGLSLGGYLDPTRPAVLEVDHCVRLNYEAFFFADRANRERFAADPVAHCGLLTDPVSKRRFLPNAGSPVAELDGVRWFFEREAHRESFLWRPGRYRLPGWSM